MTPPHALDRDPMVIPAAELKDLKVLATILGGEIVHRAPELGAPPGQ